jgi:hypothetical protein
MDNLAEVFNPSHVPNMSDELLQQLASESDSISERRRYLQTELKKIDEAYRIVSRSSSRPVHC